MMILPEDVNSDEQGTNSGQGSGSFNHVNPPPRLNRYRSRVEEDTDDVETDPPHQYRSPVEVDTTDAERVPRRPNQHRSPVEDTADAEMDPPPTYSETVSNTGSSTTSTGTSTSNSSSTTLDDERPLRSTPTNFLSRYGANSSISGCFTIDPSMTLRASAQSPLNPGQLSSNRKNLSFATQNGSISAEIWLLGPRANSNTQPKQATLSLESLNGSIRTWIDNVNGRVPVQVDARTQNGNITLHIPRSFHGYIFASAPNGDFSLSTAINAHATVLGHSHREQRYFVGDMSSVDEERWTSDELNVHSNNGRIKIGYVDENNFVNNASPRSNTYTYSTTTGGNSGGTPLRRNTFGGRGFFSNSTNTVFSGQYNVVVGNQVNINNHSINSSNHTTYDRSNANTRNNVRGTRTSTYSTPGSFNARFPNVNVNVSSDDVNEAQDVNVSLPGFSYFSRFFGLG